MVLTTVLVGGPALADSIDETDTVPFVRRAPSKLGTRLRRKRSARRNTGVEATSGAAVDQGLKAADHSSSTALKVTASS